MIRKFIEVYCAPKKEIPRSLYISISSCVGISLILVWCLLSYGGLVRPDFLPAPHLVFWSAYELMLDGSLARHTLSSLVVIYTGFLLATIPAIPIGIFMGSFRIVAAAIEPVVNFVRYLPVTSMIPLLILWIGIGFEEKITVIFIGTFFQQIILVADVSGQVSRDLVNVSYTLGATRRQVVSQVLVPAALPGVMDVLRVTMGWAWTYLVVAELVASNSGLGYMILQAMRGLHPEVIFVGILVIGLLGLITDQLFNFLRRWLLPWSEKI
jgi:NitT/TauT family transport system permease protein